MTFKKLKQEWKTEVIDILLALGTTLIAYFTFNYFNPPIQDILLVPIFFLVLILLKQK